MKLSVVLVVVGIATGSYGRTVREAAETPEPGLVTCEYNGVQYNDGDELPTRNLCLNCHCSKHWLEASPEHCSVIECPPAQEGCTPVYNESDCCPIAWGCDPVAPKCQCELRYLKHYEVKGCRPIYDEGCECPVRYHCPSPNETATEPNVCKYKGRSYHVGESIETTNPCEICSCHQSYFDLNSAEISCIPVECPSVFRHVPLDEGCYEVYDQGRCCSERTECAPKGPDAPEEKTCEYRGETYHLGQKIYPKEDPCLICYCDETWTGTHGNSCRLLDCTLERKKKQLDEGCLPIYHEETCCPIEFYCGSPEEGFTNETVPLANSAEIDSGNSCVFKGQHYALGQNLEINHPTNCVTCTCSTPPDFTCVHKSCSGPPNDDYTNCKSIYTPGQCCPTYDCLKQIAPRMAAPTPQCAPVNCPAHCREITVGSSCPYCMCHAILCSPPKCPEGCKVEEEGAPGKCPGCECPQDAINAKPVCAPVKCDPPCHDGISPEGCPMCVCGKLCVPPKCEPGCEIDRDVTEGECPSCICSTPESALRPQVQCSPVNCRPGCQVVQGDFGCPACKCDPMCSIPRCDPGCHIDQNPTGPCPGCVCDDKIASESGIQCSPVRCGPLCHEGYGQNGCPTCFCDPMCSPPKCDPGCRLEYDPSTGPCPGCVCDDKKLSVIQCSPVQCGPMCREVMGSSGCPQCVCTPMCSPPKCDPGCHIEHDPSQGPCPGCVCPGARIPQTIQCFPPKCDPGCRIERDPSKGPCPGCVCTDKRDMDIQCSPVNCASHCIEVIGDRGCPMCNCDPSCSPPRCEPGCRAHHDPAAGPCPGCICGDISPGVQCAPIRCLPGCKQVVKDGGCPTCECQPLCSPPKCDEPGCYMDYTTSPCPSCKCTAGRRPLCSMPKCDRPGCQIDYSTSPCPSCKCGLDPMISCSPPKCDGPGCQIDYSTTPCPTCKCGHGPIACSPPKCDGPGCQIDYSTSPCPSCKCSLGPMIACSPPKCDGPGCQIDYSTSPCPSCKCEADRRPRLFSPVRRPPAVQCSPVQCNPGCQEVTGDHGCPTCRCVQCSPPRCEPGCTVELVPSSGPCPGCVCSNRFNQRQNCPQVRCELPCQMRRLSPHGCPTCICHSMSCPPLNCNAGYEERTIPTERCPQCVPIDDSRMQFRQCAPVKCGPMCREVAGSSGCPTCVCDPMCSPPRCDPGCRVELKPELGPCPGCVC